ncbi:hypothetical protein BGZ96_007712 [Linnemannia gamsii]|uniref:Uncharacterized protein n=1 Tax=Linnemannia gamsii TaxID=64522 RepID=A0ABQ7K000_9FUNG|nr:hypothetical protein BGZ96_007712 [Linnemannia gamsii]
MVALDQQQQQQQSSFWRESQSQLQSQQQQQHFSPHQYRPQYPPYSQQHLPHPQHAHPAHYGHHQQQYHQPGPASPPVYRPSYEPLGYEDQDQQDANHGRSLSLNNSSGRRRGATGSRPQSQVYRKATPARFDNLSLAEQARQEHQMRRQHYQQHYHQHRQQQQQHQQFQHQHQHQQYYQAPGSRPESMYSNGHPAAAASPRTHSMGSTPPREGSQFVPPRHSNQAHHARPQIPSIATHQQQQHRHTSDVQEEALAERKRIEQLQQQQQQKKTQWPLSSVEGGLQVPQLQGQSSSVVRTSSMSRISSTSTTAVTGGNTASNIGRRTAVGKVALGSTSSSGLSRSVSTSAIAAAKMRANTAAHASAANKKDKLSHHHLKKKNSKELTAAETETKSSGMECKFLRLFRSDSKLSAKKMVSANNTESQQVQPVGNGGASSKEHSTIPVVVTIQPLDPATTPSTPSAAAPAFGLNRRRTLKDLAPSIRSLARRCSSRFSNSSNRPNSFAGSSSDPVVQFPEGGKSIGGSNSLSMTTSYLPLKLSLSSLPRSLAPGPDGIVDLQQAASQPSSPLSVKYFPPASASTPSFSLTDIPPPPPQQQPQEQEQRVPIHRKVTLFRSKTLSMYKSSPQTTSPLPVPSSHTKDNTTDTTPSNGMAATDDHDDDNNNNSNNSSTRANSLPSRRRRQRDSLRLANGHGLDFDTFLPPTTSSVTASTSAEEEASAAAVERSTNDLESALPGAGLGRSTGPPVLPAIVTTGGRISDLDQQQKARRQIISLLAMGRKDRISAKTGHIMKSGSSMSSSPSTPTTASVSASASTPTTPLSQLSPLALEAQEDLFVSPGAGVGSEEKMKAKGGDEDPCEKIAFMLVPKSRYEFQPLVVA